MNKTEIWDKLKVTDPAHTKAFNRAGGFKGTAVKPQWVVSRLTEEFGPVGVGWGMGEPSFQVVPVGNETLVYCTVSAWHTDRANVFYGVGGDKVSASRSSGPFNDDEAFKKAYTDALMNAFKFAGVAADVHMGLFDDSKYVAEAKEAFKPERKDNGKGVPSGLDVQESGPDWYGAQGPGMSSAKAKADGWGETLDGWLGALEIVPTSEVLKTWANDNDTDIKALPVGWRKMVREAWDRRAVELGVLNQGR